MVSFKVPIVALWYLLNHPDPKEDSNFRHINSTLRKYVAIMLKKWNHSHSNGISEFIVMQMIGSFLEHSDKIRYRKLVKLLIANDTTIKSKALPRGVEKPHKEFGLF